MLGACEGHGAHLEFLEKLGAMDQCRTVITLLTCDGS